MHTLVLLAALSSQITFKTSQDGALTTITPQVTLTQSCQCQVQMRFVRKGKGGESTSVQRNNLSIPANRPIDLSRLRINIEPSDSVTLIVTVSDGQTLNLTQQWPPSE
ncbi:curli assembly chaperone CsgC [Enterobacter sp. KBR-315C3_2022]|jgi:Thin aggregative fimbriae synthesis protein.|uniref:curli assembly chaperone CsgC n=1 Tax=Enterobacter sp. KBR-315C3_2022 TaxID=3242494 RepID=UPI003528DE05